MARCGCPKISVQRSFNVLFLAHLCQVPLHSLIPPHDACCISFRSVQNTTPEGVPSKCWCSLTLTLATSMGILDGAGATKGVTSPAAHRGIWDGAGAAKSWLLSVSLKKSFALIKNGLKATEIFYLAYKRNTQRWQWNTNWRHKKIILMTEWCGAGMREC